MRSEDNIIKAIRDLFMLNKQNEAIKGSIIRDIRALFQQDDDHDRPIIVFNF